MKQELEERTLKNILPLGIEIGIDVAGTSTGFAGMGKS